MPSGSDPRVSSDSVNVFTSNALCGTTTAPWRPGSTWLSPRRLGTRISGALLFEIVARSPSETPLTRIVCASALKNPP